MADKTLLQVRNELKKKKPEFIRQDGHKKRKLDRKWRKPRGWQNKIRLNKRGYGKRIQIGYGSPASVKGLTKEGLIPVLVFTKDDISEIDKKRQIAVLSSKLGQKNKLALLEFAEKSGIRIANYDTKKKIESIKSKIEAEKKRKAAEQEKGKEKEKEKKKTIEQKVDEEVSEEDKKTAEKAEKDKMLTKKDAI